MTDIAAPRHDIAAVAVDDLDPLLVPDDDGEVICDLDATAPPSDRPKPFWFRHDGRRWLLLDQIFADWQELAAAQGDPRAMMHALLPADQRTSLLSRRMELWQLEKLMADYKAHFGLDPDGDGATAR